MMIDMMLMASRPRSFNINRYNTGTRIDIKPHAMCMAKPLSGIDNWFATGVLASFGSLGSYTCS
jgi:hypothetical protein